MSRTLTSVLCPLGLALWDITAPHKAEASPHSSISHAVFRASYAVCLLALPISGRISPLVRRPALSLLKFKLHQTAPRLLSHRLRNTEYAAFNSRHFLCSWSAAVAYTVSLELRRHVAGKEKQRYAHHLCLNSMPSAPILTLDQAVSSAARAECVAIRQSPNASSAAKRGSNVPAKASSVGSAPT